VVRDGSHYVINGSKTFISNGSHCDLLIVVTKTDISAGAAGISLIVAERTTAWQEFERRRVLQKIGQHDQDTRELFLGHARAGANLLGEKEGLGFYQLMEQLTRERLIIASLCASVAESGAGGDPLHQAARNIRPDTDQVPAQQV